MRLRTRGWGAPKRRYEPSQGRPRGGGRLFRLAVSVRRDTRRRLDAGRGLRLAPPGASAVHSRRITHIHAPHLTCPVLRCPGPLTFPSFGGPVSSGCKCVADSTAQGNRPRLIGKLPIEGERPNQSQTRTLVRKRFPCSWPGNDPGASAHRRSASTRTSRMQSRGRFPRPRVFPSDWRSLPCDGWRLAVLTFQRARLRIPAHSDHRFRSNPITDSGANRSPIPALTGQ